MNDNKDNIERFNTSYNEMLGKAIAASNIITTDAQYFKQILITDNYIIACTLCTPEGKKYVLKAEILLLLSDTVKHPHQ